MGTTRPMAALRLSIGGCLLLGLLLALLPAPLAIAEDEAPSLSELKKTIEGAGPGRARSRAAASIAERFFEPDTLVPWLKERLQSEQDFHVGLALAYALAAQGEKHGLDLLVASLQRMGHLGYVYLTRVSGKDFGGPGVGWNVPAWEKWLSELDESAWRELQRKRHLPRNAEDATPEGLAAAITWWESLGYPDVGKLDFVHVFDGGWSEVGGKRTETYSYGFLVKSSRFRFTVFHTSLEELEYMTRKSKTKRSGRFEKADLERDVKRHLKLVSDPQGRMSMAMEASSRDPFGVDFYTDTRRYQGFLLALALHKRGKAKLALQLWQHISADSRGAPKHGVWTGLALLKQDTARAELVRWESEALDPKQRWRDSLAAFQTWRKHHGKGADWEGADAKILETMAAEERTYKRAARASKKEGAERATELVRGMPTVERRWTRGMAGGGEQEEPKDALSRLIEMGTEAVPALIQALDDRRFTKSVTWHYGHKAYIRPWFDVMRVQDLAHIALRQIAQRAFDGQDLAAVKRSVEAWWSTYQELGEEGVLAKGVRAADHSSPAQAAALIEKYPAAALQPIRDALESADERVAPALLQALHKLERDEAREFLSTRIAEGPIRQRMAATWALHKLGRKDGITALLADWPGNSLQDMQGPGGLSLGKEPVRGLIELLFQLEPEASIKRMRETLADTPGRVKFGLVDEIDKALGYALFFTPDSKPQRPQPTSVRDAAEALLIDLVLDGGTRNAQVFEFGPGSAGGRASNLVGEAAAAKLARIWAETYSYDREARSRERLTQRFAIVNTWRKANGLAALEPPKAPEIPKVTSGQLAPLLASWLKAEEESAEEAAAPILGLGLGVLPHLRAAVAAEKDVERSKRLDLLLRKAAAIVREVTWRDGPEPSAALRQSVEALRGKPMTGLRVLAIFRDWATNPPEGSTGVELTLTRAGDDTGYLLEIGLATHRQPWQGGAGGYIVSGDGMELVEGELKRTGTWWHDSRSKQWDRALLAPADQEVRFVRNVVYVK